MPVAAVDDMVIGESADILKDDCQDPMDARSWLKCIPKDPQFASFPPHVLLPFHHSTRFISLCKGVHTILYSSNRSFPFHGIPCHASQLRHTLFSFIFLIWDTICTIHPYSPKFHLLFSLALYTYFPAFNSFIHLLLHVQSTAFMFHGSPFTPPFAISILVYMYTVGQVDGIKDGEAESGIPQSLFYDLHSLFCTPQEA